MTNYWNNQGPPGPPGPNEVSADAGNLLALGTDDLVLFAAPEEGILRVENDALEVIPYGLRPTTNGFGEAELNNFTVDDLGTSGSYRFHFYAEYATIFGPASSAIHANLTDGVPSVLVGACDGSNTSQLTITGSLSLLEGTTVKLRAQGIKLDWLSTEYSLTATGAALWSAASAAAARTTLGLATTDSVQFGKVGVGAAPTYEFDNNGATSSSVPTCRFGSFFVQTASLNNALLANNAYYNGSMWTRGSTGYASGFQFYNGQILFWGAASGTGTFTQTIGIKCDASGNVALGGNVNFNETNFTGARCVALASGNVSLDLQAGNLRMQVSRTPASASATGTTGEICWDANYLYVCTATNTWRRVAHATW